jgi:hypothetical protein
MYIGLHVRYPLFLSYFNGFDVVLTVHRRYYVEIKCQLDAKDDFLLQILLLAQHVSGTFMQAIRSAIKNHLLHLVGILFPHNILMEFEFSRQIFEKIFRYQI